jgi:hypothetical protein
MREAVGRWGRHSQRGQSLILVAVSLVVLLGFVGLAVDVGRVMAVRRHLVQIVDASALAGAGALSGPPLGDDITHQSLATARAREYAKLNGFDITKPGCTFTTTFPSTTPARKVVQVAASEPVDLAFMPILGIKQVTVSSGARQAEAAPLDIVILQDCSVSQLIWNYSMGDASALVDPSYYPIPPNDTSHRDPAGNIPAASLAPGNSYDPTKATTNTYPLTHAQWQAAKNGTAHPNVPWEPFARQQWAARYFVNNLDLRYDQVGIASFSSGATVNQPLTSNLSLALAKIGDSPDGSDGTNPVGKKGSRGLQPDGGTNIAQGISAALNALTDFGPSGPARDTAVGAIILLTDGSTTTRLGTTDAHNCYSQDLGNSDCVLARSDVIAQAQIAAQKGVVIYTIFVGDATWEHDNALLMQYVADLTDNRKLDGTYTGSRNLPNGYGPAFNSTELATVTSNYYRADPAHPEQLQAAYDSILAKIYTRVAK